MQAELSQLADLEVSTSIDSLGAPSEIIEPPTSVAVANTICQFPLDPEKVKFLASAYADVLSNGALDAKPKEVSYAASAEFEPDSSLSPASTARMCQRRRSSKLVDPEDQSQISSIRQLKASLITRLVKQVILSITHSSYNFHEL